MFGPIPGFADLAPLVWLNMAAAVRTSALPSYRETWETQLVKPAYDSLMTGGTISAQNVSVDAEFKRLLRFAVTRRNLRPLRCKISLPLLRNTWQRAERDFDSSHVAEQALRDFESASARRILEASRTGQLPNETMCITKEAQKRLRILSFDPVFQVDVVRRNVTAARKAQERAWIQKNVHDPETVHPCVEYALRVNFYVARMTQRTTSSRRRSARRSCNFRMRHRSCVSASCGALNSWLNSS